ncbi:MAG TPA: hypothetical protein VN704_10960 [Verrucomicrobiae bacterium]|nr:hypothetical protein [Verrucomicrobiae bacterium]
MNIKNNITANNITANNNTITKPSIHNLGQINNQKVICIVTIGTCNLTSGQVQSK